ncbi:MAG: PIN domain-containing protein [bacterium]|nr:PIN domain-containing protein [bacterium]
MNLLLDTDVLIDVALDRSPHAQPGAELLDFLERRPGTAHVAWHSISNFYYIVRPSRGGQAAKHFVLELARFVEVAPTTTQSLLYACQLEMGDFEDAMQVAAAIACEANMIVTRNLRDYAKSPIRAVEPLTALAELSEPDAG